jgi:PAS domain S-box-containing protein
VATSTRGERSRAADVPTRPPTPPTDPDGGAGDIHDLLTAAVTEAAGLLKADGAMVYLLDPDSGILRFAHDAGIESPRGRELIRAIRLPIGVGLFGSAVASRTVVVTGDYLADPAFEHAPAPDEVVREIGVRSMVVAPMVAGDEVFGAFGTFSGRRDAFDPAQIRLVRALADHAAAAMRNARLIEALDASRGELARRAQTEQVLREIGSRITVMRDPDAILQDVVEQAARLVGADGVILDLLDPRTGNLHWALDNGLSAQFDADERAKLWISVGVGATGIAVAEDRVIVADDDLDAQFPPSPESTEFYERTGFHSMIAAPITGDGGALGVLEVYSRERAAFDEDDARLVGTLAGQAAIAITNARLIDQLARSRGELARTAEAERTLREIAGRVSSMRDQDEILQSVIDASVRLLGATGAMIDLLGRAGMAEAWASHEGGARAVSNVGLLGEITLDPDAGVSGRAVRTRQVEWTGEYLADQRFQHTPERDAFVRESDVHSVIAAPLIHRSVVVGAITVYGNRVDAFGEQDAGLLAALADQAAIAIANARLIEELEGSRTEIARRADSERTLREIAARVSAILEPAEVLQRIVDEATRLLESDGARIDLYDPELDALRWSYAAGDAMSVAPEWATTGGLRPGQAVAGTAFAEQRPARTDDYLADDRFARDDQARAFVERSGIRSVIAVPLAGDAGPLGTLSVVSRRPAAYDDADAEVLTAMATQASIAIRNARLMDELAGSRDVIQRRAEAERALREIAARITAIRTPGDLLQHVVDEAQRLLRADGAVIDQFNAETRRLEWAYDAGLPEAQREAVRSSSLRLGEGLSGTAVELGRVMTAGDYLSGVFTHDRQADVNAARAGIGDLIVAPIIGESGPLGAIEVFSHRPHTFDAIDEAVLGGLADQAAIAFTNARLIEELERSRAAVAKRADTERALREITARIAALREPEVILRRVVDEAKRLLDTDGAHLTRMSEDRTYLVPVVEAGSSDPADRAWLLSLRLPLGGGINGLAARFDEAVWTADYRADPRIPHEADDTETAERLGLVGMASAPLRAPGGEVIGTLAVSSSGPRAFDADELDLLQGLADQAAIAITNSSLLGRLTESETRYRYLVERAPDLVWSIDADARLTFVSDAVVRLTGRYPEDLIGRHFGALLHESSRDVAEFDWTSGMMIGSQEVRGRINLLGQDGEPIPAEFIATARLDDAGQFIGANGSVRDMRERDKLERDLRDSESRYRFLVENSPDIVFATDAEGHFTFMADTIERVSGWRPEQVVGQHFSMVVDVDSYQTAATAWQALASQPTVEQVAHINMISPDGRPIPVEVISIGMLDPDGRFAGIHGSTRDISERARLERELRRQAGELAAGEERAHLARELHDSVTQALFSMTLVTRAVELLLDQDPAAARAQLGQLRELQREALAEMRALIFELRPGNLEQDGLIRALRTHTAAIQGRIGLPVVLESTLRERLPLAVEEVLYRIAQEALHNVIKHAAAHQVRLEVDRTAHGVLLRIIDDGKGFDPTRVPEGHLGLAGMRARADRIGARFTCRSGPGKGTTIEVDVPDEAIAAAGPVSGPLIDATIRAD